MNCNPIKLKKISGCWRVILCLSALSVTSAFTQAKAAHPEKTKTESELHLGISEAAFNRIARELNLAHAQIQRTDVYFDVHKNREFHLRRNIPHAKLRVQMRADELVSQKSWVQNQQEIAASNYIWLATTRTSANLKQRYSSETGDRIRFTVPFLISIVQQKTMTPEQRKLLEETWSGISWPKLQEFDKTTSNVSKNFIPAAVVHKERWIVKIPGRESSFITVQLGRDSDALGQGKPVSFEIESELESSSTEEMSDVANAASNWLQSLGIETAETSARSSHDFFSRLESIYP